MDIRHIFRYSTERANHALSKKSGRRTHITHEWRFETVIAVEGLDHSVAMECMLIQLYFLVQISSQILIKTEFTEERLRLLNFEKTGSSLL